jgi:hypothetical protein
MAAMLIVFAPATSEAARAWLLPSQTIVANSGGWVTVDAAMADDLFSFNQGAMPIDALSVTGPDGQPVAPQNPAKGKTRSSFDLELRQAGTYRIAVADNVVMARWEEDGKPKRWRGTPAEMATGIPANAAKLEVEQTQRRVETFVTVGSPTDVKPPPVPASSSSPCSIPTICMRAKRRSSASWSMANRPRTWKSRSSRVARVIATRRAR